MSDMSDSVKCARNCWIMAAIAGLVFAAVMYVVADWGVMAALFFGAVIAVLVGVLLGLIVCSGSKGAATSNAGAVAATDGGGSASSGAAAEPAAAASDVTASAAPAAAPASLMSAPAAEAPKVKPSAALAGQAELADRKGEWKYEGDAAPKPAKKKAPAKKAAAKKAPAKKAAEKKAEPAAATEAAEAKPATLYDAPPAEGADDLKLISGVGPKLEQTLNDLGVYRFAQVADWGPSDIAWVDNRLKFKGRITRDDWMSQAKILADGGETEFSARKKK